MLSLLKLVISNITMTKHKILIRNAERKVERLEQELLARESSVKQIKCDLGVARFMYYIRLEDAKDFCDREIAKLKEAKGKDV